MNKTTKAERLLNEGEHFCIIPWVHLHVTGLGHMSPCFHQEEGPNSKGYGNLNEQRFSELWQGEGIRDFRLRMLDDRMDPRCARCYHKEKLGSHTLRQRTNARFKEYIEWVANTDTQGYAPDAKPLFWDIRFSNLCNLRCRTCCYSSSSSWFEDEKRLGLLDLDVSQSIIKGVKDTGQLLSDLDEYFPYLEQLYFAGGEPLLIKENHYILRKLADLQKFNVEIIYSTNLTKLNANDYEITGLWKKFAKIKVAASIDAIGERGEYIRKGIKWNEIAANIKKIKQECPHIKVDAHTVVSVFNILHLPDLHRELVQSGFISADRIHLNLLQVPHYYNIKILSPALKKAATAKLKRHLAWIKQQPPFKENEDAQYCQKLIARWNACINHLNSDDWTGYIPEFKEQTARLDEIRKENCLTVLPELEPLLTS